MEKCIFCNRPARNCMTIKKGRLVVADEYYFCDKCEVILSKLIIDTANKRMHDLFGDRCITLPVPNVHI